MSRQIPPLAVFFDIVDAMQGEEAPAHLDHIAGQDRKTAVRRGSSQLELGTRREIGREIERRLNPKGLPLGRDHLPDRNRGVIHLFEFAGKAVQLIQLHCHCKRLLSDPAAGR